MFARHCVHNAYTIKKQIHKTYPIQSYPIFCKGQGAQMPQSDTCVWICYPILHFKIQIESKLTTSQILFYKLKPLQQNDLHTTLQRWHTWYWFIEWIFHGQAGVAGPHTGLQPAEELLRGIRTADILQRVTLGPLSFVFLPFVGDRSQICGVRGTLQITTDVTQRLGLYTGRRRGPWSGEKNTRTEMRFSICCVSRSPRPF